MDPPGQQHTEIFFAEKPSVFELHHFTDDDEDSDGDHDHGKGHNDDDDDDSDDECLTGSTDCFSKEDTKAQYHHVSSGGNLGA